MTRLDRVASTCFVFLLLCFTCTVGLFPNPTRRVAYDAAMNPRGISTEAAMTATVLPHLEFDLSHARQASKTKPKSTTKTATVNSMAFKSTHNLMEQRNLALVSRRTIGLSVRPAWIGSR